MWSGITVDRRHRFRVGALPARTAELRTIPASSIAPAHPAMSGTARALCLQVRLDLLAGSGRVSKGPTASAPTRSGSWRSATPAMTGNRVQQLQFLVYRARRSVRAAHHRACQTLRSPARTARCESPRAGATNCRLSTTDPADGRRGPGGSTFDTIRCDLPPRRGSVLPSIERESAAVMQNFPLRPDGDRTSRRASGGVSPAPRRRGVAAERGPRVRRRDVYGGPSDTRRTRSLRSGGF